MRTTTLRSLWLVEPPPPPPPHRSTPSTDLHLRNSIPSSFFFSIPFHFPRHFWSSLKSLSLPLCLPFCLWCIPPRPCSGILNTITLHWTSEWRGKVLGDPCEQEMVRRVGRRRGRHIPNSIGQALATSPRRL